MHRQLEKQDIFPLSFSLLCHPSLLFHLIKSRVLKFFPGHLFVHALTFVDRKYFGRTVNIFSWYPRKACVYMGTI